MLDRLNTNPTQFVGIIAFAAATIACGIAARHPSSRDTKTWMALALINCLFLIEIFVGLRHRVHDFAVSILIADGEYGHRGPSQEIIIALFAVVGLSLAVFILFWNQSAGGAARIGASIAVAVLALFAIETVSLHALDAIFYRPIASVLLIGWIWALASSGTVLAASLR